jgi:chromosome segregation ATPase
MTSSPEHDRSIEQLKEQYEKLNERKIETKTELKRAEEDLAQLQKEANEEFGTSDVAELNKKLEKMEAENKKNRQEYQALLDKIETDLAAVEKSASEPAAAEAPANE